MTSKFEQKINTVEWLLTDGATGTNLFDMGLMFGDAPELWNEKYPNTQLSNLSYFIHKY